MKEPILAAANKRQTLTLTLKYLGWKINGRMISKINGRIKVLLISQRGLTRVVRSHEPTHEKRRENIVVPWRLKVLLIGQWGPYTDCVRSHVPTTHEK